MPKRKYTRKSRRVERELSASPPVSLGSPPQPVGRRPKLPLETYTITGAGRTYGPFLTTGEAATFARQKFSTRFIAWVMLNVVSPDNDDLKKIDS